jgi:hypothetical protein
MSKRLFDLVVRGYELKGAAYQVMLALAWNSSATNECSISISDLAADAHLTKKSVIRALQLLTSAHSPADRRSILIKAKQGFGVGVPNTYRIDLELLRDLNSSGRDLPATRDQRRRAEDIPTPGRDSITSWEASNGVTPVECGATETLRGRINQNEIKNSDLIGSADSRLLSRREVNKISNAHANRWLATFLPWSTEARRPS